MFKLKPTAEDLALEKAILSAYQELETLTADMPEYDSTLEKLERLYKLKSSDKERRISADTAATIIGNLAGIGMILGFERAHVVTSKALGFILKPKI